jgi:hypothetical protein
MKKITTILTLLFFTSIFSQIPTYVPPNGLVGYWPFTGNANDESVNGNNGSVFGATLTTDRFGAANCAYSLNGTNDYISALNPLGNLTSDFSISCFISINTWNGGLFVHIGIDQVSFPRNGFGFGYGGSQAVFPGQNYLGLISNVNWYQSGYQFENLLQWYHAVVVRTGNSLNYFVNGINVGASTIPSITIPSNILYFGGGSTNYALLNGKIDDIGIWNRALTQAEITSLYGALSTTQNVADNTITIYPNPANDHITIDCGNLANVAGYQIKIVNTLGQEVFSGAMNTQQYVVPLNTWTGTGVYFVKIYDANNNLLNTKKIILQ